MDGAKPKLIKGKRVFAHFDIILMIYIYKYY